MDALSSPEILLFGPFRFDRRDRLLFRCTEDGRYLPVSIGARALAVLEVLTERPGRLVSKDEIMRVAWQGLTVEEGNLTVQISTLRRVLDAGSEGESCIQTMSGKGYRFVWRVTQLEELQSALPVQAADAPALPGTPSRSPPRRHWLAVGLAGMAIGALVIALGWGTGLFVTTQAPQRMSIVVLPFDNLGGGTDDDYLVAGVHR